MAVYSVGCDGAKRCCQTTLSDPGTVWPTAQPRAVAAARDVQIVCAANRDRDVVLGSRYDRASDAARA